MFKKFEDLLRSVSYSVNDNNEPENITIMLSNGYQRPKTPSFSYGDEKVV